MYPLASSGLVLVRSNGTAAPSGRMQYYTLPQGGLFFVLMISACCSMLFLESSVWSFPHQDLQLYLSNLANQIDRETSTSEIPLVIILDDINDPISISELVNGALTCKYHKW